MGIFDKIADALKGHENKPDATTPQADAAANDNVDMGTYDASTTTADKAADDNVDMGTFTPAQPEAQTGDPFGPGQQNDQATPSTVPGDEAAPASDAAPQVNEQPPPPAPAPEPAAPQQQTYTVEEGDNLSFIGERYGVSVDELVQANNIENPDLIFPGQVLTIPQH